MINAELAALSLHIRHSPLNIRASRVWPSSSDHLDDLVQEVDADPLACFFG
jgi:hypothetical protein